MRWPNRGNSQLSEIWQRQNRAAVYFPLIHSLTLGGVSMFKVWAFLIVLCVPALAETNPPCIRFSVLTQDVLGNVKQGLSPENQKWLTGIEKKSPSVCYVEPSSTVSLVFVIIITTHQRTRIVNDTSSHTSENPVSGTIRDEDGNISHISGTVETTTTTTNSRPVPYSEAVYTLSVERRQKDGSYRTLQRFQQVPYTFLGRNPVRPIIQKAVKWVCSGEFAEQERIAAQVDEKQPDAAPAQNVRIPSGDSTAPDAAQRQRQ
jgi:hypothetical protein